MAGHSSLRSLAVPILLAAGSACPVHAGGGSLKELFGDSKKAGFEMALRQQLFKLLDAVPSARAPFEAAKRPPITYYDSGDLKAFAKYYGGSIHVNRRTVEDLSGRLRAQGVSEADLPAVAACKLLPIVAHEAQHGENDRAIAALAGREMPLSFLEEEFLAFRTQDDVRREVARRCPQDAGEIDAQAKDLARSVDYGAGGLKSFVMYRYSQAPSVFLDDGPAFFAAQAAEYRRGGQSRPEWQAAADFTADPEKLGALRSFYRAKLDTLAW